MDILRVHFKPSAAISYHFKWKHLADTLFPPGNVLTIPKQPGEWNQVDLPIDNPDVDWVYVITGICAPDSVTPEMGVIVRGKCNPVGITAEYVHIGCAEINDIIMTAN